jgi:L-amino acid N-acyltransferase YncA
MDGLKIRRATPDDCEAIADLSSGLNKSQGMTEWHRPDVGVLEENFDRVLVYLAETEGQTVGFVAGFRHFNPHNAYSRFLVTSIYVTEGYRRKGIGSALLNTLIMELKEESIRQIAIDVMPFSEGARALYESLGFEKKDPAFLNYRLGFDKLDAYYGRNDKDLLE